MLIISPVYLCPLTERRQSAFNRSAPCREKVIYMLERKHAFTNYPKEKAAMRLPALEECRAISSAVRFAWQYFFAAP